MSVLVSVSVSVSVCLCLWTGSGGRSPFALPCHWDRSLCVSMCGCVVEEWLGSVMMVSLPPKDVILDGESLTLESLVSIANPNSRVRIRLFLFLTHTDTLLFSLSCLDIVVGRSLACCREYKTRNERIDSLFCSFFVFVVAVVFQFCVGEVVQSGVGSGHLWFWV